MENNVQYDADQLCAIRSTGTKTLVLAGPGAGKTKTLTGRIRYIIDDVGVSPKCIAAVTYTNASARVIVDRVGVALGHAGTIHSLLYRLICRHNDIVGCGENPVIIDEEASEMLILKTCSEHRYRGNEAALLEAMKDWSRHSNPSPQQAVVMAYRRKLRNGNALDFDSIIHWGRVLLVDHANQVRWSYSDVLLDEAQDCSDDMWSIFDAMPCKRFFAVGDGDQSIMSFTGASDGFQERCKKTLQT